MSAEKEVTLVNHLSIIQDPRVAGRMTDMVVMAVCPLIAVCENWVEIEQWSEHHQA